MTRKNLAAALSTAVSRRDLRGLSRAARACDPDTFVRAWPKLSPLERVAAFRALTPHTAAEVFAGLPAEGKWLAYLGEISEGAAPLLERAKSSDARLLRRVSARERAKMRKALA